MSKAERHQHGEAAAAVAEGLFRIRWWLEGVTELSRRILTYNRSTAYINTVLQHHNL